MQKSKTVPTSPSKGYMFATRTTMVPRASLLAAENNSRLYAWLEDLELRPVPGKRVLLEVTYSEQGKVLSSVPIAVLGIRAVEEGASTKKLLEIAEAAPKRPRPRLVHPQDLVMASGVADMFGVTVSAISRWFERYDTTPTPLVVLSKRHPIYDHNDWIEWGLATGRRMKLRRKSRRFIK